MLPDSYADGRAPPLMTTRQIICYHLAPAPPIINGSQLATIATQWVFTDLTLAMQHSGAQLEEEHIRANERR